MMGVNQATSLSEQDELVEYFEVAIAIASDGPLAELHPRRVCVLAHRPSILRVL